MKSSTLASYLETIANAIRASKSPEVPSMKWTAFKGPTVLHIGAVAVPVPAGMPADLGAILFPNGGGIPSTGAVVSARNELADMNETACNLRAMADRYAMERDTMAKQLSDFRGIYETMRRNGETELAQAQAELQALRRTVHRLRQGLGSHAAGVLAIQPAKGNSPDAWQIAEQATLKALEKPTRMPVVPQADLLNAILDDYSPKDGPAFEVIQPARIPSPSGIAPQSVAQNKPALVLCFPLNGQGKTLSAAAVTLAEVKDLFTFKFNVPKDPTRGGYWLAKDPTGPRAQELARTLAKEGATIGHTLPETANR